MKARASLIILRDALFFGTLLAAFALFHHILPRKYAPIRSIIAPTPSAAVTYSAQGSDISSDVPSPAPQVAIGDFSYSFPEFETGAGAKFSYQTESLRIAVSEISSRGVTYFVADIRVKHISQFKTAFAGGEFSGGVTESVRRMAADNNAILAVSGDFCGAQTSGTVIRNGVLYREDNGDKDVCVLYYDGTMEVYAADEFSLDFAIDNGAWQAWSFGPNLLDENGDALTDIKSSVSGRNPRCAIGYFEPGHYCLVVVDGRQEGYSSGMSLEELSALMASLDCRAAYNLDGGATAMMAYDGEIVSNPPGGGRKSSDIIYFAKEG